MTPRVSIRQPLPFAEPDVVSADGSVAVAAIDPGRLPMAGIPPRLLMLVGAIVLASWLILAFARQVGDAAAAGVRADDLRAANAALELEIAALDRELTRIQDPRYVALVARGYRLGSPDEIPFTLSAAAPPLAADAPGSASVRLGADPVTRSPLESWLQLLFGPAD